MSRPVWPARSRPGPCSRKCPDRTPTHRVSSLTLDSLGGVPSRLARPVPGRQRAPRTTPPQAGFCQPTARSGGQRTPSFYAPGNNSENFLDPKLDSGPMRKWLVDRRSSNARADVVSPRWGSGGTELVVGPEIPGLRCAAMLLHAAGKASLLVAARPEPAALTRLLCFCSGLQVPHDLFEFRVESKP
jgi:hypothetical protein